MSHRVLIALLLASSALPAQLNWIQSPVNGHIYALTPVMTWQQAEAAATSAGGHLATVRGPAEQNWIWSTFGGRHLWIGYTDELVEGQWRWSSGKTSTFTNWMTGEPNNQFNEDYAAMDANHGGRWNDAPATSAVRGVIEFEAPVATAQTYGAGCTGTNGTPTVVPLNTPVVGTVFQIDGVNLPQQSTLTVGFFGFSRTAWSFVSLPYELSAHGLPGCYMYAAPPPPGLILTAVTSHGQCNWSYAVPVAPWLTGLEIFFQALVPDPGAANPLGATVTNGIAARIGL